jgi:hypothetical protein
MQGKALTNPTITFGLRPSGDHGAPGMHVGRVALEHGVEEDEQREEEQAEADDEPGPVALNPGFRLVVMRAHGAISL